jgi:hypothetical protein
MSDGPAGAVPVRGIVISQRLATVDRLRNVRTFIVVFAFALAACGDLQPASQALGPASPSPTPLPSGVVDPQPLLRAAARVNGAVLRVDDAAVKLVSTADYSGGRATVGPGVNAPATVWVIAIVGDIRQTWGLLPRPNAQCKLYAYWASTGELWSTAEGALSMCQPYFARSLAPPDAPVRCASDAYDNGVSPAYLFSRTRSGPIDFTAVRDDAWRQPTIVRGAFLAQAPEGSVRYEDAFCLRAFVRAGPAVEKLLASGVAASVPSTLPQLDKAIWLRGYHALSGFADEAGHIDVVLERRVGYEWAFFDWHALVPDGGYAIFRFLDEAGHEILPWRLVNGP